MKKLKRGQRSSGVNWELDPEIKKRVNSLIKNLDLEWLSYGRIFFYRSHGSKARAYARTWGLPRLWQKVLKVEPAYIVEVISEYFDKLDIRKQDEVLLHELSHIPKNFSGSLTPHTRSGNNNFHGKLRELLKNYENNRSSWE
jgi:predicted metallopeptidase